MSSKLKDFQINKVTGWDAVDNIIRMYRKGEKLLSI